jgi:transposase
LAAVARSLAAETQRWLRAGCCAAVVQDRRLLLRVAAGRDAPPTAGIVEGRTVQSTPQSGARAGDDGHKRRTGAQTPAAVDTLGQRLGVLLTPANEQERAQVEQWAAAVQEVTGDHVDLAYVDDGSTGDAAAQAAAAHGSRREVVAVPQAKQGGVLLPTRWIVARDFAWAARFRRLARDYERLAATVGGLSFVVCASLMLQHWIHLP